jgi:hypothetical protein
MTTVRREEHKALKMRLSAAGFECSDTAKKDQ